MQNLEHKRAVTKIKANHKMGNGCARATLTKPLGEPLLEARGGGGPAIIPSRATALAQELSPERAAQMIFAMEELVREVDILKSRMATLEGGNPTDVKPKVKSDQSWIKGKQPAANSSLASSETSTIDSVDPSRFLLSKEDEVINVPMTPRTLPPNVSEPEIYAMSTTPLSLPDHLLHNEDVVIEDEKYDGDGRPTGRSIVYPVETREKSDKTIKVGSSVINDEVPVSVLPELSAIVNLIDSIPGDYGVSYLTQKVGSFYNVIPVIGKKKIYCVSSVTKAPGGNRNTLKLFNAKRKPAKVFHLNEVCMNLVNYVEYEVEADISNLDARESQGLTALVDLLRHKIHEISLTHIG